MYTSVIACVFCLTSSVVTHILLTRITVVVRWLFLCKFFYYNTQIALYVGTDSILHHLSPEELQQIQLRITVFFFESRKLAAVNGIYVTGWGEKIDYWAGSFGLRFKWWMSLGPTARVTNYVAQFSVSAANLLWNNLLEPVANKSRPATVSLPLTRFLCPTEDHPFIYTTENSVTWRIRFPRVTSAALNAYITCASITLRT
jgi:hypothetical protein